MLCVGLYLHLHKADYGICPRGFIAQRLVLATRGIMDSGTMFQVLLETSSLAIGPLRLPCLNI